MTEGLRNIPDGCLRRWIPVYSSSTVCFCESRQVRAQEFSASAEARHHRALRYSQGVLNLLVLEIIYIGEQNDLAILLRELLKSSQHIFVGEILRDRRFVHQRLLEDLITFVD